MFVLFKTAFFISSCFVALYYIRNLLSKKYTIIPYGRKTSNMNSITVSVPKGSNPEDDHVLIGNTWRIAFSFKFMTLF